MVDKSVKCTNTSSAGGGAKNVHKKSNFGSTYSYFLFESPLIILLLSFLLFGCAPFVILFYYPLKIDSNPEKVLFLFFIHYTYLL